MIIHLEYFQSSFRIKCSISQVKPRAKIILNYLNVYKCMYLRLVIIKDPSWKIYIFSKNKVFLWLKWKYSMSYLGALLAMWCSHWMLWQSGRTQRKTTSSKKTWQLNGRYKYIMKHIIVPLDFYDSNEIGYDFFIEDIFPWWRIWLPHW